MRTKPKRRATLFDKSQSGKAKASFSHRENTGTYTDDEFHRWRQESAKPVREEAEPLPKVDPRGALEAAGISTLAVSKVPDHKLTRAIHRDQCLNGPESATAAGYGFTEEARRVSTRSQRKLAKRRAKRQSEARPAPREAEPTPPGWKFSQHPDREPREAYNPRAKARGA